MTKLADVITEYHRGIDAYEASETATEADTYQAAHDLIDQWTAPAADEADIHAVLLLLKKDGAGKHSSIAEAALNAALAYFDKKAGA